jgi:hypothetical protein
MGMYDIFPRGVQVKCFPVWSDDTFKSCGSLSHFHYGGFLPMQTEKYSYPSTTLIVDFNLLGECDEDNSFENEFFSIFDVEDNRLVDGYFSMSSIEEFLNNYSFENPIVDTYGELWKVSSFDELKELAIFLQDKEKAKYAFVREHRSSKGLDEFLRPFNEKIDRYRTKND